MKTKNLIAYVLVLISAGPAAAGSFAVSVISYDPGDAPARKYFPPNWDYDSSIPFTTASAALGAPDGITDGFSGDNILSAFNPASHLDEIVSIGEGGQLTLQLANYINVAVGRDVGVFGNVGLAEADWMNATGTAGDPAMTFGADPVTIEVSFDRGSWAPLGETMVDMPTNYYLDPDGPYLTSGEGLGEADFSKPFTAGLSDFDGKSWPEILTLLDGSAGGNWLDLSPTGLSQVGYVRFSVPDDGDSQTSLNFELDAVSIADGHIGQPVPEPGAIALLAGGAAGVIRRRRRR